MGGNGNIIPFGTCADVGIQIERTPEFFETAKTFSDYLAALPLTAEQNDTLVELLVQHVTAAEKSGFAPRRGLWDFACQTGSREVSDERQSH